MITRVLGDISKDETIVISVHQKFKCNLPSFGMLGNTERRTKVDSIDMHRILKNLSKPATCLFWTLIERRDPTTNQAYFVPKDNAQAKQTTKAYKELKALEVIKRIKRGLYLINPCSFIPSKDQFEIVKDYWDSI